MQESIKVKIKNQQGEDLTTLFDIFDFTLEKNLNDASTCIFSVNFLDQHLSSEVLSLGTLATVYYTKDQEETQIHTGYISNIKHQNQKIYFTLENWIGYLSHCIADTGYLSVEASIANVITDLYHHYNTVYDLPFQLGKNDLQDIISVSFQAGDSFLERLQKISEIKGNFCLKDGKLNFSEQAGEQKNGLLIYNVEDPQSGNLTSWEWETNIEDFANKIVYSKSGNIGSYQDDDSIARMGRKYGKFESRYSTYNSQGGYELTKASEIITMPKVTIDVSKIDWQKYQIGDQENVKLYFGKDKDYLNFDYLGTIQKITLTLKKGTLSVGLEITEKYKPKNGLKDVITRMKSTLKDIEITQ